MIKKSFIHQRYISQLGVSAKRFKWLLLLVLFSALITPVVIKSEDAFKTNSKYGEIQLTPQELAWLQAHQELRVAVKHGWMPIEFKLESDQHRGISVDYLEALASIFNFRITLLDYSESMNTSSVDVISGVVGKNLKHPEFKKLTHPFLNFPFAIYVNKKLRGCSR